MDGKLQLQKIREQHQKVQHFYLPFPYPSAKNSNLETFFNTPAVKLVHADGKVTGVIAKDESGKYIQFNASKGVILATGDYMNNEAMVKRWCPDVDGYGILNIGQ